MKSRKYAVVDKKRCVACGECTSSCRIYTVSIKNGCYACVDKDRCVGCGLCIKNCPVGCMVLMNRENI